MSHEPVIHQREIIALSLTQTSYVQAEVFKDEILIN